MRRRWRLGLLAPALLLGGCGAGLLEGGVHDDAGLEPDALPWHPPDASPDAQPPPDPAPCPRVVVAVAGGDSVKVRRGPDASRDAVGLLFDKTIVTVREIVPGADDDSRTWYLIKAGALEGYLPARAVRCTERRPPAFDGFFLPLPCGKQARVSQGNHSAYSHNGDSAYAFDFSLATGTKIAAMAPGTVSFVYDATGPGDACYGGGGPACRERANRVWIKHPDGSQTIYGHLSKVHVVKGQRVMQGQVIALSGSTGYSSGPHLHAARMRSCCQTIPLRFADLRGDGVPNTGAQVKSANCP